MKTHIRTKLVLGVTRLVFRKPKIEYEVQPTPSEPAVFIANHAGAIGPIYSFLYFDMPQKTWIIQYVTDKDKIKKFIFHDFFHAKIKKPKFMWKIFASLSAFFLYPTLVDANGIPVYHDKRIASTFEKSVETLKEGKNIVIFPESPQKFSPFVNTLYSGFADIGRRYYDVTGKALKFYPCYLTNKHRLVKCGAPVSYNPLDEDKRRECERIATELRDSIDRLARSVPKHKPIPFLDDEWYRAYGEHVNNMSSYWKMFD